MIGTYINGANKAHGLCNQHTTYFKKQLFGTFNIYIKNLKITTIPPLLNFPFKHIFKQYWLIKIEKNKEIHYGWSFRQTNSKQRDNTLEVLTEKLLPNTFKNGELKITIINAQNIAEYLKHE